MGEQNGEVASSPPKRTFQSYQYKDGPDYDLSYADKNHKVGQRRFEFAAEMQAQH